MYCLIIFFRVSDDSHPITKKYHRIYNSVFHSQNQLFCNVVMLVFCQISGHLRWLVHSICLIFVIRQAYSSLGLLIL